ncbi:MAG: hypothetical protein KAX31_07130 [Thermoplasmata archaeon]|nr:hypothetical protein [Thermoplasmata archaeon]
MDNERHIKGVHLINVIDYVKWRRGVLGLNKFFEEINRESSPPLGDTSFSEKEWYPYELYITFLRVADQICGSGDLSRCYEVGLRTIQNLGHLSYLTHAPDIHELVQKAHNSWGSIYDFGRLEIVKDEENEMILRYHGYPEVREKCEYFRGSLTGTLEICKLKGVVEETTCNTEGAEYCEFTLTWE